MALGCQIIDLVRLYFLHDADQIAGVGKIPIVQYKFAAFLVWSLIQMINTICIEQGGAAFDTVDFIALVQKEFRQIGTVLPGNAGDECFFHIIVRSVGYFCCIVHTAAHAPWFPP